MSVLKVGPSIFSLLYLGKQKTFSLKTLEEFEAKYFEPVVTIYKLFLTSAFFWDVIQRRVVIP